MQKSVIEIDNFDTIEENYPEYVEKTFIINVPKGQTPERLDKYLTTTIYNATRNKVQKAIDDGKVLINNKIAKSSQKIQPLDEINCTIMKAPPIQLLPQHIPLDIKYEDEFLIVVNKPPGMCTHPGYGHRYGTMVNAILYHFGMRSPINLEIDEDDDEEIIPEIDVNTPVKVLSNEGQIYASDSIRPGIVHRLDKDTSGVLVIAKNPVVHNKLSSQFAARTTEREYNAVVWGDVKEDFGTIEGDIGRSPKNRKLFAVVKKEGKPAKTDYTVIERFGFATLVRLKLHTGRTHQIRVHLSHIKHPVWGDEFYGGDKMNYGGHSAQWKTLANKALAAVNRQMLHARTLGFTHPVTKEFISFSSDLPDDMINVINILSGFNKIL